MRPPILIRLFAAFFCMLLVQACNVNPFSNIVFENRSASDIDSAVVWIQQYRMVFHHVPANTSRNWLIHRDSVQTPGQRLLIRAQVYTNGALLGQNVYANPNSAIPEVMYTISFKKDHTIHMHPGSVNAIKY